jgi:hypothetical protein
MDAVENQRQVSHRAHSPWKIANDAIPTFPQPRRGAGKWKTKSTFPTFPLTVLCLFLRLRKEGLAADRFAPAPGSFFDEKMLSSTCK